MSWLLKWTWNPETPARVPAGARISAGKSGSVETSLPSIAEAFVNWVPANCMPSPESPAKTIVTEIKRMKDLGAAGVLIKPFDPRTLAADVLAVLR